MDNTQEVHLDPKPFGFDTWIDWAVSGNGLTHGNNGISWRKACQLAKDELKSMRIRIAELEAELKIHHDTLNDVEASIYKAKDIIRKLRQKYE